MHTDYAMSSKKSTRAKAQRLNGSQYFTTVEHSDSASEYSTSAEPDSDVSSSEAEEPAMLPGPTLSLKSQKCKLKSAYTGDSKRNKFRKQNYWLVLLLPSSVFTGGFCE